jgi:hypothetical protein
MTVLTRELGQAGAGNESWSLVYDVEARHLFVESDVEKMQFSIDAFMAQHRGAEAQDALVGCSWICFRTPQKTKTTRGPKG